ncbi:MAG: tetratricopeptide repeat protein [Lewinellaceae bacterium]|nr:tetratricopeptide repeat protein [Lewinellaceae bacterium]
MNIGYANHVLGNIDEALKYTQEGLALAQKAEIKDSIRIAGFYQNLGLISEKQENYSQALEYYFASLRIKEKSAHIDKRSLAKTLDGIAGVYNYMENYESALEFYKRALSIRQEMNDIIGVFSSSYNLGIVYQGQNQFELARIYYQKALMLAEELENEGFSAYCYDALGDLEKKEGNFAMAIDYIRKSLDTRRKNPQSQTYAHTLYNLSEAYFDAGDLSLALKYAEKFKEVADFATLEDREEIFRLIANIYEKNGKFKKSLEALKSAEAMRDSLEQRANSNLLMELNAKYNQDLARADAIHEKEKEFQFLEVKAKNRFIARLTIALVCILILLFALFLSNLQRKKINARLVKSNEELNESYQKLADANQELNAVNRQLEVSNNSLQQFTFAASHDLKESLRSVISFSQILGAKNKDIKAGAENDKSLTFIRESSLRMSKTLDDLLNYANLSADLKTRKLVDINNIFHELKNHFFSDREVDFSLICEENLGYILGNPVLIKNLFFNIIDNSIKFASEKRPLVIIVRGQHFHNNGCLFSFKDNGKGIEKDYLDYIFKPFKRLNNRDSSGSGLGLSVCRKIVDIYGGKIWAESVLDEGTTIFVEFNDCKA